MIVVFVLLTTLCTDGEHPNVFLAPCLGRLP